MADATAKQNSSVMKENIEYSTQRGSQDLTSDISKMSSPLSIPQLPVSGPEKGFYKVRNFQSCVTVTVCELDW